MKSKDRKPTAAVDGKPVFQLPTATNASLGEEKWGAGPTAVLLKQEHGFTYGMLLNHVWSFAGQSDRADVDRTYLQPFVSYTTKKQTTFSLNTESSYDWERSQWIVPLNFMVQQLVKFGNQPIAFQLGYRYYAEKPSDGPGSGIVSPSRSCSRNNIACLNHKLIRVRLR